MKIPINKDLDTDFKNEIWKGLEIRDLVYGAICIAIIGITAFVAGYYLKVPTQLCVLIGIVPALPVFLLGFHKIQGMTMFAYFKEFIYDKMTEELFYDADEIPNNDEIWTMQIFPENRRENVTLNKKRKK